MENTVFGVWFTLFIPKSETLAWMSWDRRQWFKNYSAHNDQVLKLHASHWWIEPGSVNQCVIKVTWEAKDWNIEEDSEWHARRYNCHHLWELWSEQRGVFQDSIEVLPAECSWLSTITALHTIPECCLWSLVISPHQWVLISQRLSPEQETSMAGKREIILNSSPHRLL